METFVPLPQDSPHCTDVSTWIYSSYGYFAGGGPSGGRLIEVGKGVGGAATTENLLFPALSHK